MTREVLVLDDALSLPAEAARRVVALAQQRVAMAGRFAWLVDRAAASALE